MTCKHCNSEMPQNAKFCNECGQPTIGTPDMSTSKNGAHRPRSLKIGIALAVVAVIFVCIFAINVFGNSPANRIKGIWTRETSTLTASEQLVYYFTSKGGTLSKSPEKENYTDVAEFEWYVTDDEDLIILWSSTSCNKYTWNPDYQNYNLSPNESNWCIKGDKLYLSSPTAENGYYVYTK